MSETRPLSFSIEGEIITDIAREHFYVNNDLAKAIDLLMSCLQTDQVTEYERMGMALEVLDGKAEIRGHYPGPDYGLYELDERDERFGIAQHFNRMAEKLEAVENELRELQMKFSIVAEIMTDSQRREANTMWFYGDSSRKRPIFVDMDPVPRLSDLDPMVASYLERMRQPETKTEDYGWLEPNGTFHPVEFANHEHFAYEMIKERGWQDEYDISDDGSIYAHGDFLVNQKGWVLLHNPYMGVAGVTRNETKSLTKAQKEFLFDYYMERDDSAKAAQFLED